tara:strand:- start:103 stop:348 length:246 start_codon:yes stop_codon:yes gene_type:complete
MEKIPYSEQIRRGYNYLANRVHELKEENKRLASQLNQVQCFYNAATAENERLKANVRAFKEAYAKASERAKKSRRPKHARR